MALQHLRSSTAHKRPIPTVMSAGQIAINTNEASPGLFFKDSNGDLVKVGPVHIGTNAPNSSPASVAATALVTGTVYQILTVGTSDFTLVGASANTVGTIFTATGTTTGTGTVSGQQGVEKGEQWLDTTGGTYVLKIYDGTAWRSESGTFVDVNGDTMTGDLVMNNANIVFEGATADDFETTLTVTDATADRTIVLPDVSGDIVTTGDTGTVTSTMIADGTIVNADINASAAIAPSKIGSGALPNGVTVTSTNIVDGTIVNADVNASAAIAGTKIDPDFGSQTIETTGVINAGSGTAAAPSVSVGTTDNGVYSPGTDQVAISTNGTGRLFVDANGNVGVGTSSPRNIASGQNLQINASSTPNIDLSIATVRTASLFATSSSAGLETATAIPLSLGTSGIERLRITSDGKLGLGTSSPDEKLGVAGAIRSTSNSSNFAASDGLVLDYNTVDNTGRITAARNGANSSGLRFYTYNSGSLVQNLHISPTGVGIGTTSVHSKLYIQDSNTGEQLTIRSTSGNSGEAGLRFNVADSSVTTDAYSKGSILFKGDGSGNARGSITFNINGAADSSNVSSTNERMRIDSSGRVGIGTSSPSNKLHIAGTGIDFVGARIVNTQHDTNNQSTASLKFGITNSLGERSCRIEAKEAYNNSNEVDLNFYTNTANSVDGETVKMTVKSNGNVGVGTTTPGYKLSIADSIAPTLGFYRGSTLDCLISSEAAGAVIQTYNNTPIQFSVTSGSSGFSERARIDSSGRLLVGTSSARSVIGITPPFQIEGISANTSSTSIIRNSDNAFGPSLVFGKSRGSSTGLSTIVDDDDTLGSIFFIGADGSNLSESSASISAEVDGTPIADAVPGRLVFSTTADGASSPTERMRITNGGTIFVHKTTSGLNVDGLELVKLSGGTQIQNTSSNNGTRGIVQNMRYGAGTQYAMGIVYAGTEVGTISCSSTATAYNTSSDYRLKENVTAVTDGISRLQQLKPSRFNFIADPDKTVDGFLAHEVQTVVPEAITGEKDAVDDEGNPQYQGIDQSKLVPLLTAALQEAVAKIESLEARLTAAGL